MENGLICRIKDQYQECADALATVAGYDDVDEDGFDWVRELMVELQASLVRLAALQGGEGLPYVMLPSTIVAPLKQSTMQGDIPLRAIIPARKTSALKASAMLEKENAVLPDTLAVSDEDELAGQGRIAAGWESFTFFGNTGTV